MSRRPTPILAGALVVAALCLVGAWMPRAPRRSPEIVPLLPTRTAGEELVAETLLPSPTAPVRVESPTASAESAVPDPVEASRRRARAALSSLARELQAGSLDRPGWELMLNATADSLVASTLDPLPFLEEGFASTEHAIAAAELVRVLGDVTGAPRQRLPDTALELLRGELQDPEPSPLLHALSCRSLAALGEARDRSWLLSELVRDADPAHQRTVSWALQSARDGQTAAELLDLLEHAPGTSTRELALSSLDGMLRHHGAQVLDPDSRRRVAATLDRMLLEVGANERRLLSAALALRTDQARDDLLARFEGSDRTGELAQATADGLIGLNDELATRVLSDRFLVSRPRSEEAVLLAQAVVRGREHGKPAETVRQMAIETLLFAAEEGETPAQRRRAIHALQSCDAPASLPCLERILAADPEPSVRTAAARAIASLRARSPLAG
jgi:hypothetical protein